MASTGSGNAVTDIAVDGHGISLAYEKNFVVEPQNEGIYGQALITDGEGGRIWQTITGNDYTLPVAGLTLGGIKDGGNLDINMSGIATVTGTRNSTMAFAEIPTAEIAYNELLARLAGWYSEIASKLNEPANDGVNGQVLTTDGSGGRSWTTVTSEGTEYTLPVAGLTLGGIKDGGNLDINTSGIATVTGTRNSTMAFAEIPTAEIAYNELLARLAGWYSEIAAKLNEPANDGTNGQVLTTDGAGGTSWIDVPSGGSDYTLPVATQAVLGGIRSGTNLTISSSSGMATVTGSSSATTAFAQIPTSTTITYNNLIARLRGYYNKISAMDTTLGGKITEPTTEGVAGQVLTTDGSGGRSWTTVTSEGTEYTLPIATDTTLGGIKAGGNADVDSNAGTITVTGIRNSTMAFAEIPTTAVTYDNLLSRLAGWYSEISGKAPSIHAHEVADVSGLQAVLDGKANANTAISVTLPATDWAAKSGAFAQTVAVAGATATSNVIVSSSPSNMADYTTAGVYCSDQGTGMLTFCSTTMPIVDLIVNVVVLGE